ncbi:hypothetical protein SCA03_65630 [Streptomyces cacaoi]|uniref:Uncharacterized protein n=1 Tax=Streptomyces cacaoi TaxID=1898 RepID=A0A4Y3R8P8_STRCI|nr:hypothetical protein SCA03_65630 [Streptomyces cacaoi]
MRHPSRPEKQTDETGTPINRNGTPETAGKGKGVGVGGPDETAEPAGGWQTGGRTG